jgi:hypothetical protein
MMRILTIGAIAFGLAACGGGPKTEDLLRLPYEVAENLRAGEFEDALSALTDDCDLGGMNKAQLALWLPRMRDPREVMPFISHVELLPERDTEVLRLVVFGLFVRAPFETAKASRLKPFRVTVSAKPEGGSWKVFSVDYDE